MTSHQETPLPAAEARSALSPTESADRVRLLESAVVNSYDSIVITDAGSPKSSSPRIIYVNEAFTRLSGYEASEVIGRSPSILQGPESDMKEVERMRQALQRGEAFTSELVNYRKNGRPFHVEARIMPIRDADGRVTHWVGVQRDISERKRAELEHARMEVRMRETQKLESLGVLAGGIAHDFNNLLTIIVGSTSLVRTSTSLPAADRHLQLIESASLRAAELCRQMLAYSGQGRYEARRVDVNGVIRDTADLARNSMEGNYVVELDLAAAPPLIVADAGQMQQVIMNLVVNAIEAIGSTAGRIRLATRVAAVDSIRLAKTFLGPELAAGDYVIVEVFDNGCGIPREIIDRVFDPFFSTKFVGRGLGLAAVLGIVRGHHGAIEVESEPGQGTRFRLFFPALAATPPAAVPPPAPPPMRSNGRTVLVVDDEQLLRETTVALLQVAGFTALTAADGVEAVEVFRQNRGRISAVLLDLSMPRLDGAGAFAELRRLDPGIRVLLMSGFNENEALQRFAVKGIAGFLQKPFTTQALLGKLNALLEETPA